MKKRIITAVAAVFSALGLFACGGKGGGETEHADNIDGNWHTYVLTDSEKPTCTDTGLNIYTCSECGYEKTETVPTAPHEYGSDGRCVYCGEPEQKDPSGKPESDATAFKTVSLTEDGVLSWSEVKGASKYVLSVEYAGAGGSANYDIDKSATSKDLDTLRGEGFPSGKSTVTLTAWHYVETDDDDFSQIETPIDGASESFRVTVIDGAFELKRLKFADARITLDGFYSDKVGEGDGAYYLYELALNGNKATRFNITKYLKPKSGYEVSYYKNAKAREERDPSAVYGAAELTALYMNHGENMFYALVTDGVDDYEYDLCVYGLYTLDVERYSSSFTVTGGIRVYSNIKLGETFKVAERDIITENVMFDGAGAACLARDGAYNLVERGDYVLEADSAHVGTQPVRFYIYDADTVREDCAEYAEYAADYIIRESDYGMTLIYTAQGKDEAVLPDIIVGKKVLTAQFYGADIKTLTVGEGATGLAAVFSAYDICPSLNDIWLPSTITNIAAHAFTGIPETATLHCAFTAEHASAFDNNWNHIANKPLSSKYKTVYGEASETVKDGLIYKVKDGAAVVAGVKNGFGGVIPATVKLSGREYAVTAIDKFDGHGAVEIGKKVAAIAKDAFIGAVAEISVADGNTAFVSEGGVLYSADRTRIIAVEKTLDELEAPSTVSGIDAGALTGCDGLILYIKNAEAPEGFTVPDGANVAVILNVKEVVTSNGFRVVITNADTATAVAYRGRSGAVEVPRTVNGKPVTEIAARAFADSEITSIVIPDCVERMGGKLFEGCHTLEELTLPFIGTDINTPTTLIELCAFASRDLLREVTVTAATELAPYAFTRQNNYMADNDFPSLKTVNLPDTLLKIGDKAFMGLELDFYSDGGAKYLGNADNGRLILFEFTDGTAESFNIDARTKIIYDGALYAARGLTELTIPSGVSYVGNAVLPKGATFNVIVDAACDTAAWHSNWSYGFGGTVSQGKVVESADGAFRLSVINGEATVIKGLEPQTTALTVPDIIDGYAVKAISLGAFSDYVNVTELTVPVLGNGMDKVHLGYMFGAADDAQAGSMSKLTKIVLSKAVTNIGERALYGCGALTELVIPTIGKTGSNNGYFTEIFGTKEYAGSVAVKKDSINYYVPQTLKKVTVTNQRSIKAGAFSGCGMITEITVEKCGEIGSNAFNCRGLKSLVLPAEATYGNNAIMSVKCTALESITLPLAGQTLIGILGGAFVEDSAAQFVKHVNVIDAKSIDQGAFAGMTALETVELNSEITYIGKQAFAECTALSEFTVHAAVKTIGLGAFSGCTALANVTFENKDGWTATRSQTGSTVSVSQSDLQDPSKAAECLTTTYKSYIWKCS